MSAYTSLSVPNNNMSAYTSLSVPKNNMSAYTSRSSFYILTPFFLFPLHTKLAALIKKYSCAMKGTEHGALVVSADPPRAVLASRAAYLLYAQGAP
jgi:hypothetical protein